MSELPAFTTIAASEEGRRRASAVKFVGLDVDGVLTDGGIYLGDVDGRRLEFKKYDGGTALEVLLRHADKDLVKLEVDCGWVHVAGEDPADFIARHEGRVALLHVKDVKAGFKPTTDFVPVPLTEVGRGAIDWKKVFAAAKKAGVKRYYVEQDTTERPPLEAVKISRDYLHDLNV